MKLSTSVALAALAAGLSSAALLAGCGSGTKTVSATTPPTEVQTSSTATQPTTSASTTPTSTSPTTSTGGGTPAQSATRTAPEPAFTRRESHAEGVGQAAELVRRHGYTPNSTSEYHSGQTLRVLVGTRTGSADGYGQQAFFFVGGRYIGTDTKEPSATVEVLAQSDSEVTLSYPLYKHGDPLGSPSGGHTNVRFQLNNGRLTPLSKIPPASASSGLARK